MLYFFAMSSVAAKPRDASFSTPSSQRFLDLDQMVSTVVQVGRVLAGSHFNIAVPHSATDSKVTMLHIQNQQDQVCSVHFAFTDCVQVEQVRGGCPKLFRNFSMNCHLYSGFVFSKKFSPGLARSLHPFQSLLRHSAMQFRDSSEILVLQGRFRTIPYPWVLKHSYALCVNGYDLRFHE